MKPSFLVFCCAGVLAVGCHQVTEYQVASSSSLVLIGTSNFSIEGVMEGLDGGMTIVPGGMNEVLLLCFDGTLHRLDLETLSVDTSYAIGGSSGTGYGDAALAVSGSLYALGPGSQVVEVDLEACSVVDNFTPGSSPGALAASPTLGRLYFIDTAGDYIGEIFTGNNSTGFTSGTSYPLADLMVEPTGGRHIVAVCSNDQGSIYSIWLDVSSAARLSSVQMNTPCSAVVPMTEDSVYAVSCPMWSSSGGKVVMIRGYREPTGTVTVPVEGHPVDMCFNRNSGGSGHLSVLSRTGSGGTVVTVAGIGPTHMEPEIEAVITLDGFPRDIISPGNGEYIIVLTSE